MHPTLQKLLSQLGPLIQREINMTAAMDVFVGYEWEHPYANPIPTFIANAGTIFPDENFRPIAVALLSHFQSKVPQ